MNVRVFGKPLFVLAACLPCCIPLIIPFIAAVGIAGSLWALFGAATAALVLGAGAMLVVRMWLQRRGPAVGEPVPLVLVEEWQWPPSKAAEAKEG